jgi:serpin B
MFQKGFLLCILLTCLSIASEAVLPKSNQTLSQGWVLSSNQLGIEIFKSLEGQKNVCISPFGISSALTLLYFGSGGETLRAIEGLMHFTGSPTAIKKEYQDLNDFFQSIPFSGQRDLRILSASSLWVASNFTLAPTLQEVLVRDFKAAERRVDFSRQLETARYDINSWVRTRTDGKTEEMIPYDTLNENNRLVAINAFVFRAKWDKIDFKLVQPSPFFASEDLTLAVPTIMCKGNLMTYEDPLGTIVQVPYSEVKANGPRLRLILIIPKSAKELDQIQKALSLDQLTTWINQLTLKKVSLVLPKFQLNQFVNLDNSLQKLGLKDVYTDQADFTKISGEKGLMLSQTFHRSIFSVTQMGTEEPLSSTFSSSRVDATKEYPLIQINHPFLFIVTDQTTGAIILLGRMVNPSNNNGT